MTDNQYYRDEIKWLRKELEMYKLIFDSINEGALVTDPDGTITHFNKPYGQFLELNPEEQIGKHCQESVENSRMHIVGETGIPEINQSHQVKGQSMVVQRIPIKKDGKVIAVYGQVMFKNVKDVSKLAKKLSLLESKVELYEQELADLRSTRHTFDSIIGSCPIMTVLKKDAFNAAQHDLPVLITGESGTGKELFAQAIHQASDRKRHPLVRINCAAIPKDLLESELFGYDKGAFTGARSQGKPGKIELADRGTLFLDEIAELPLDMQPKLLRVLEEKEFERIGGTSVRNSDFRLIAATNQNLEQLIKNKLFRNDLYYRLNVFPVRIPPLRERKDDIEPISNHLLKKIAARMTLSKIEMEPLVTELLKTHDWPGNIRELSNVLERAATSLVGDTLTRANLPLSLLQGKTDNPGQKPTHIKLIQAEAEKTAISAALRSCEFNKTKAAEQLGIHRTLLYKKMKKYGIPVREET
ncbi:MAG: sigma 54-interacting transcriptional regulator [Proteobacteria bacterium]|nr:sigma 54-interacting transcriptional regulator [Pseudomonadota bacterium]